MNDFERTAQDLAIATAIQKRVGAAVKTGDSDNLRGRFDGYLTSLYAETGADRVRLYVAGQEVGSASVRPGKPGKVVDRLYVNDAGAVTRWAQENWDDAAEYIAQNAEAFATWQLEHSGAVCDGCEVVKEQTAPTRPVTTVRVPDPAKVGDALQGQLPDVIAGLLEDGE